MRYLVTCFVVAMVGSSAFADVVQPVGLAPGSQYQLLFVTEDIRDATSTDIADYNAFVTAEAAMDPLLPQGLTWRAVGSTLSIDAITNAPAYPGIPVYNTQGQLLVPSTRSLYARAGLDNPVGFDQFGDPTTWGQAWTGTTYTGLRAGLNDLPPYIFVLGTTTPYLQNLSTTFGTTTGAFGYGNWLESSGLQPGAARPLYGLSSPITVAPEPSTLALAALGGLALLAHHSRRALQSRA